MSEKAIGYVLLAVGVGIILFSAGNVYGVFTRKIQPVQLFGFKGIGIDMGQIIENAMPKELAPVAKTSLQSAQKTEIIPAEMLNGLLNIMAQIILMGFIGGAGQKLASLGVMLLRPVEVKMRESVK